MSNSDGSPTPPGFVDINGKRYPVDGDGNITGGALSPDEVSQSQAHTLPGQEPDDQHPSAQPLNITANIQGLTPEQEQQKQLNNHFEYGGQPGGAAAAAGNFNSLAQGAQGRQGEQIDYSRAHGYGAQAQGNAAAEGRVADLMWKRANGLVPSIAQMQGDRQMGQLTAAQSSAAASARGPAALALAQQQAAANTANGQSQISNQVQINAAQERQQAEQAAFGAYSGMRGQDYQGQGLEQDAAQKQAAIDAAQRAQNDAYSTGLYGLGVDVNKAQLQAQGNQVGIVTGAAQSQAQRDQNAGFHQDDQTWKTIGAIGGGVGTALGIGGMAYFGGKNNGGGGGGGGGGGSVGQGDPSGHGTDQFGEQGYGGSMEGYKPPDPVSGNPAPLPNGGATPASMTNGSMYQPKPPPTMVSDVTAKQNIRPLQAAAWDEGRRAALDDMRRLGGKSASELKAYGDSDPFATEVRNMRANAWDEGRRGGLQPQQPQQDPSLGDRGRDMLAGVQAQGEGLLAQGPAVGADRVTNQFADGLAPSFYDYKPGYGTPGQKMGPMADSMAANPVTGSAVRQNPHTGLLSIDNADGLKVALGGVGHLAEKQRQTDMEIARLKSLADGIRRSTQTQSDGLMSQGPSVSDQYLNYVRGL